MNDSQHRQDQYAVVVRHAYKKYGSLEVLKDLNMSVRKGTIYSLLGASGCGKTTLLSCVVGRLQLDSGDVRVLGITPGTRGSGVPGRRIGYMPQELSLYHNFTIRENVIYFGMIFEMKIDKLKSRLEFLVQLLDLPDSDTTVKNLSGGQQRRVSFIVAILHDAELLIMDEPTVGMDPVLRQVIWEYMLELTTVSRKTIIITTHYIEESRQADTIGLVRNGCLLEEASPHALLDKYSCETLEEVFLALSKRQEESLDSVLLPYVLEEERKSRIHEQKDVTPTDIIQEGGESRGPRQRGIFTDISSARMYALLYKNVLSMWRDVTLLLFFFGQCAVALAALYFAFGHNLSELHLAVVNHDATSPSPTCQSLVPLDGFNMTDLSCHYLAHMTGSVTVKEFYNSTEDAQQAVRSGKAWGALHFAENFTYSFEKRLRQDTDVSDDLLEQSSIVVWLDMSNQAISWIVKDELYAKYREFSREILIARDLNPSVGEYPIKVFEPVYGIMEVDFLNSVSPGVLLFLTFLLGVALSVLTIVHERVEGLLTRNIISGVTTLEIMLAYISIMFVMICAQAVLIMIPEFLLFGYYNVGDITLIAVFLIAQGTSGLCYGFMISSFCNDEGAAIHIATGSLYPLLFVCGILWPVEGMNTYMYHFSKIMPLTLPAKAFRWILLRGWTMRNLDVLVGFLTIFIWMAVFLVICAVILRYKKL